MLPDHYATPASATYPCVLKVAAGEHGEGVDIVQNAEEVRKLSRRYDGGWLLQELVVGAEVGVLAARRPRRDQRRDRHQVRVRQGGVHLAQ